MARWGVCARRAALAVACAILAVANAQPSEPGGAGHALLFSDNVATIDRFYDMPTDELTFEAWVQTSDGCHTGALFSYAEDTVARDDHDRVKAFNSFVVYNIKDLLACRDFELLNRMPDPKAVSCRAAFRPDGSNNPPADITDGNWHHVAVTWSAREQGLTTIYVDGLKRAEAKTGKTKPIKPGGALVLGAEQDCFGGCFDKDQAFYGYMDEVRMWKRARTQKDILRLMRYSGDRIDDPDLVAYWKFDDPKNDRGSQKQHLQAMDSSGKGNSLTVVRLPSQSQDGVRFNNRDLGFPAIEFQNNYLMNSYLQTMPAGDITIEFWAKTPAVSESQNDRVGYSEILSFASVSKGSYDTGSANKGGLGFIDDAILIEKYNLEFQGTPYLDKAKDVSTVGSISIHINANREGNGLKYDSWIDFPAQWTDDAWHHIAVTWRQKDGRTQLFFDGRELTPFWSSVGNVLHNKSPRQGGVDPKIGGGAERSSTGSLVIAQNQECYAGCFSPSMAYHGSLAELRVWDKVLRGRDIKDHMQKRVDTFDARNMRLHYDFSIDRNQKVVNTVTDRGMPGFGALELGGTGALWHYSHAPLETSSGDPVEEPKPGAAGHALQLDDQQVLMLENFQDFPGDAITLEFWMWSVDKCSAGTPFSYATGDYNTFDNSFLLSDYNNWIVAVMEDEGTYSDHHAGLGATDGLWHHIALTWESSTGLATLYDNGRPVWRVKRGQGKIVPSGGTLVIGREQDCMGGCFDSGRYAKGDVQTPEGLEYGPQDFFGMVEEMRMWRVARTNAEIIEGMRADDGRTQDGGFDHPGIDPDHPDLVAYWKFDAGTGFTVRDVTGKGHDLRMTYEPKWRVVNWVSICGNGVSEGAEQCDDGNTVDGDGCSRDCRVEPNWFCTQERPSVCTRSDTPSPGPAPAPYYPPGPAPPPYYPPSSGTDPHDHPGGGGSTKKHKSHHGGVIAFFFLAIAFSGLVGVAYIKREDIYDRFPQVRRAVEGLGSKLRMRKAEDYGMLQLDDADAMAPDFVDMQPGPDGGYRPPSPRAGD